MALAATKGTLTAPNVTGSVTYNTVGFQPKVLLLWHGGISTVSGTATAGAYGGFGVAGSSSQWAQSWGSDDVVTASNAGQDFRSSACITILNSGSGTAGSAAGVALFTGFTSTGFTLNWTTASATINGAIIHYLALGGADLTDVTVGASTFATANGSAAGPNVGFQPDAFITCAAYQTTSTTASVDSHSTLGFAANYQGTISQGACQYFDNDAGNTMDVATSMSTTAALVTNAAAASTTPITAVVTAFTATGWTWTWSNTAATANMQYGYVALKGGAYKVVSETSNTTNATKTTSGVGFTPVAALHAATLQSATGSLIASLPANTAELMIGAVAGANEGSSTQLQFDAHADSQATKYVTTTRAISLRKYTSATVTAGNRATQALCGEADITLQSDGWQAAWTSTDGTAYLYQTLVIGAAPAATQTLTLTTGANDDDLELGDLSDPHPLRFGATGSAAVGHGQGFSFPNCTLTAGDTITSAYLSLMKSGTATTTIEYRLTAIDEDNRASFTTSSPNRPGDPAIVLASIASGSLNQTYTTGVRYEWPPASNPTARATLGAALQAVKARGGWTPGNSIAVVNNSDQDASAITNFSRSDFHDHDSATASSEPQLIITYIPAAADPYPLPYRPKLELNASYRM